MDAAERFLKALISGFTGLLCPDPSCGELFEAVRLVSRFALGLRGDI